MPTLFVYLPCYNEAGNLRRLTEEWLAEAEALARTGYQLAVIPVDDRSTDDTLAIARQLAQEQARVRVIAHAVNQNLGGVVKTAIGDFLQVSQSGDLMCLMDGDDTHKPRFIHGMLAKITREKQCVIASRYQPGARVQGLQASRKLFSDGARLYYTLVLHVPGVKDYTGKMTNSVTTTEPGGRTIPAATGCIPAPPSRQGWRAMDRRWWRRRALPA